MLTASAGVVARWGEGLAPGAYAHVGIPITDYPFPAMDAGFLLELRSLGAFRPGLKGAMLTRLVRRFGGLGGCR